MNKKTLETGDARPSAPGAAHPDFEPEDFKDHRYSAWENRPGGLAARAAMENLARRMASGWPRRGHKLLEMFCADGYFLEMFWHFGFDVTGHDQSPRLLGMARERLKNTADFALSHPESLPYDDHCFDYVVCLAGLEFAENPQALVSEMFRLATRGVLLAFPSAWSLYALGSCWGRRSGGKFFSPLRISSMIRRADESGTGKLSWGSTLLGPGWSWEMPRLSRINSASGPLPIGAVNVVRVDFNPPLGSSSILVTGKRSLRRETASSSVGRVSKLGRR